MPRFRRGASSSPGTGDSSADVPGILDGPVKPDDEERRGITAPRARFCGSGRSRAACGTTCRPYRRETSAQFRSCWATRRSRRRRFIPASTRSGIQVRAGRRGSTRHCAARSSDRRDEAQEEELNRYSALVGKSPGTALMVIDAVAEIRARVRAAHQAEGEEEL